MELTQFNKLSVSRRESVLTVEIVTGHKRNAICFETLREMIQLAQVISGDSSILSVIVTGRSDVFTGGMNLDEPVVRQPTKLGLNELRDYAALGPKMCRSWEELEAITFAAIEGPCVGAGVALSLALDFRVCSEAAQLYVPEIERCMTMSWQSVPRSVNLIGPARTKRMFILADPIDAQMASTWGWADYLTPVGGAVEQAAELANRIAQLPPLPVKLAKSAINASSNALNHAVSFMDTEQLLLMQHTEDYEEGIRSFLESRAPKYRRR